jgi:hypothetical protein
VDFGYGYCSSSNAYVVSSVFECEAAIWMAWRYKNGWFSGEILGWIGVLDRISVASTPMYSNGTMSKDRKAMKHLYEYMGSLHSE